MINKYNNFILESVFYDLLLESSLELLNDFKTVLNDLKTNTTLSKDLQVRKIIDILLELSNKRKDLPLVQNYIDLDTDSTKVSFVPDNKIKYTDYVELLRDRDGRFNTVNINHDIIKSLKIPVKWVKNPIHDHSDENLPNEWKVLGTYNGVDTDKYDYARYTLYLIENTQVQDYRLIVFDDENREQAFRKKVSMSNTTRGSVKVGRFVNKILDLYFKDSGESNDIKPAAVEKFSNAFSASVLYSRDSSKSFEIVDGEAIKHWYLVDNYSAIESQLGSSCMRHKSCQGFFSIYIDNPDVCKLLILKDVSGEKINGRALLWTDVDGNKWMDRVYCIKDSYINLFNKWATDNGYPDIHKSKKLCKVKVKNKDYGSYPYMDTFYIYKPTFVELGVVKNEEFFYFGGTEKEKLNFASEDKDAYLYNADKEVGDFSPVSRPFLKLIETNGDYNILT
jgi:hypothetical protein